MNDHPDLYIIKQSIRSYRDTAEAEQRLEQMGAMPLHVAIPGEHTRYLKIWREGSCYYVFETKLGRGATLHLAQELYLQVVEPTELLAHNGLLQYPNDWSPSKEPAADSVSRA